MASARPPPRLRRVRWRDGGGATALWEWRAAGPGPPSATAVLIHATGFHSRCWDEVVRSLPETFQCICLDMHGHGRSDPPSEPSWRWAAVQLREALADAGVALGGAILVGHSMGGHMCALIAAAEPVRSMLLIDPIIFPRKKYEEADTDASRTRTERLYQNAAKRKASFSSADEMHERFKDRPPFSSWRPRVLRDYCEHGLGSLGQDGLRPLLCTPAVEANCYVVGNARATDPSPELRALAARRQRAVVLRPPVDPEDRPFVGSAVDPALAQRLGEGAEEVLVEGASHFIPMTHPELVARHVERLAGRPSRL